MLADNCYSCHSHEAKRNKGGFYLDSRQGILDAFLAEPGNADPKASMLIKAVRYEDADYAMPPKGKLPEQAIADLEKWVEMGLPWPEEQAAGETEAFDLEARRESHWAWQPPKRSGEKSIDAFLNERLAAAGLAPAPLADRATLIRRVTLDLTGLPPTDDEVRAFVNDDSPNAYEHLVDRLLDSPRYGEQWGRHWLDTVRYAESYGHEFDFTIPHAWKYRDYIIRALNDDIPYHRVVKEHIAGDLIEPRIHPDTKVNEAVVATGWWFMHEQSHAPTDVRLHEHERMDNQIDVMSKAFMGVTVSCARCHDHKFDAISDEDYYSLMGYLHSSRQQEAYLDHGGKIGHQIAEVRKAVEAGQARFEQLDPDALQPETTEHDQTLLFEDFNAGSFNGWLATGWAWGERPTVPGQWDPTRALAAPVRPGVAHSGMLGDQAMGTLRSPEFDVDRRFAWVRVKGKGQVRMVIDSYTMARYNKLLFEGLDVNIDTKGKWKWVRVGPNRDLYAGRTHNSKAGDGKRFDHRAHLAFVDDHADAHLIVDEVRLGGEKGPPNTQPPAIASVDPAADAAFASHTKRFNAAARKLPKPQRALAITDGSPDDTYLHIRGGWRGIGEPLPRRFLTALGGEEGTPAPTTGSGRDDLARRIVDPDNPLPARVRVNRIWHHLFGRGLSPTVDNFGVLGVEPSHPELLDHLAVVFVEDDRWSNKAMIKRIVMTDAYRRTSDKTDDNAEAQDPTNVLLHRQNIRRMTAEMIRDAMLVASGSLNEKRFGPPVPVRLTAQMQGRGRPKSGPLDGNGRRSIYTSVRRNFLSPMMLTFDAPIPFSTVGRRNVTNVPAQSLTLMNDPFVHDQAKRWAQQLVQQDHPTPGTRIDAIFFAITGQAAEEQERVAAVAFLNRMAEEIDVPDDRIMTDANLWQQFCHVAFNLKRFIYIR
ncbi:MAG: PSD1 and planctomycete cytochrome C domain-containing protein [Phycisphaeraceae bacterium]